MAKANVNIENVDNFRQGIEVQRDSVVDSVDTYNVTLDETKEALAVEKEKAVTLIGEVQSTLSVLLSKIEEQRAKVEELQASLAALEASEPEEYETVYEPDVTDDEGNVISEGGSYEVETAAHIAWRNEVDKLSGELANEEDRLAQMEEVESKLQAVASKLEEQQARLDELYAELEGSQEEVNARRGEIESFSESAIEKLNKISLVLQEYLSVQLNNDFVNVTIKTSNSTSSRNIGDYSFPNVLSDKSSTSRIYDTSRADYDNYAVARNAIENIKEYFNTKTIIHGYEHAHFPIDSSAMASLTEEQLELRKKFEAKGTQSSFYSNLDVDQIKQITILALYNCEFVRSQRRQQDQHGNIIGARTVYDCSLGTCVGRDRSGADTDKVRVVIEEDPATDNYIVTVFPFI